MKIQAWIFFTVVVAIAACWQPLEEEVEGLPGETARTPVLAR
jgi:hypothetical protein